MKLSLKWFSTRRNYCRQVVALGLVVVLSAGSQSANGQAPAPVPVPVAAPAADVLNSIGLQVTVTPEYTDGSGKTVAATATITSAGGLATDLKLASTTAAKLTDIEGTFATKPRLERLILDAAVDGIIHFTADSRRRSIPTAEAIHARTAQYGIDFKKGNALTIDQADLLTKQAGLQVGNVVTHIDGVAVTEELHAGALFFIGISNAGRVQITTTGGVFHVPVIPVTTGVGRGVAQSGPHVAFPPFLQPGVSVHASADDRGAHEVISARVETYYFRDAHRLAQILNRGVQSYQAAAVSLLERSAESARDTFDQAKSGRREAEFNAERVAQELRQKKKELGLLVDAMRARVGQLDRT